MRTIPIGQIIQPALQLCGLDVDLATPQRYTMIRDFINMRLRSFWEMHEWTDLKRINKCTSQIIDERRAVVLPSGFGQIITIWNKDPFSHNAIQKDFDILGDVIYLKNDLDQDVWVESRAECPYINATYWNATTEYFGGQKVFYQPTGEIYVQIEPNGRTAKSPPDWPPVWQVDTSSQIPKLFANALIHGVHSDFRRSTGEIEASQAAEADCQKAIDAALDQTLRQQGSIRPINFRGY